MFYLLSAFGLFLGSIPLAPSPHKNNLRVDIQNIRRQTGKIYIGLYRASANFPSCPSIDQKIIDAKGDIVQTVFSVEPGEYAIAVYHDENNNGHMDKRMFGIPKEPYGFSNNYRPLMSAPTFNDCKFAIGEVEKEISIKLN